jgi:hypothetical protein
MPRLFLADKHCSEEGNAFIARVPIDELARRLEGFPACDG